MKRHLLVLLFLPALMQTRKGFGQDSLSHVSVVISPALFVPISVAVQGGLQVKLSNRVSILAEAAFPTFYPKNTVYEEINYWRAGVEFKYYLRKSKDAKYISLQTSYLYRELADKEQSRYYTKTQTFAYTNAVIHSPVLSTALKMGVELPVGKRTYFDLFAGAGVRIIITTYQTESALLTSIEPNKQSLFSFDDAWLYNYTLERIHLTVGLRFGVRL